MLRYRLLFAIVGIVACVGMALIGNRLIRSTGFDTTATEIGQPILVLPTLTNRRVLAAGGHPGEVEITLEWHNKNDLDLSCIDPKGDRIWYGEKRSPTGGRLDVDANASVYNLTRQPVEHIVWPYGAAPPGVYQVYVTYFAQHDKVRGSQFHVTVNNNGHYSYFGGTLSQAGTRVAVDSFSLDTNPGFSISSIWSAIVACLICAAWTAFVLAPLLPAIEFVRWRTTPANDPEQRLKIRSYIRALALFSAAGFVAQVAFIFVGWLLTEIASVTQGTLSFDIFNDISHMCGFAVMGMFIGASARFKVRGMESGWLSWVMLGVGAVTGYVFAATMYDPYQLERLWAAGLLGGGIGFMMCLVHDVHITDNSHEHSKSVTLPGLALNRAHPVGRLPGIKMGGRNENEG